VKLCKLHFLCRRSAWPKGRTQGGKFYRWNLQVRPWKYRDLIAEIRCKFLQSFPKKTLFIRCGNLSGWIGRVSTPQAAGGSALRWDARGGGGGGREGEGAFLSGAAPQAFCDKIFVSLPLICFVLPLICFVNKGQSTSYFLGHKFNLRRISKKL